MAVKTLYGADISQYQGAVNWSAFNPGASFVFIKAGGGDAGLYTDSKFAANRDGARALGHEMPHGFYWFGGTNNPIDEANYFCDLLKDLQSGEVLVLDSESGAALDPNWCKAFLDQCQNRLGVKPLIYMSSSKVTEHDWSLVANADYGLWVANYSVAPEGNVPIKYWKFYAFHQYSSSGSFPGISGKVDTDAFFANDISDFYKYGKPDISAPPPVPVPTPVPDPVPSPTPPPVPTPTPDPTPTPTPSPTPTPIPVTTPSDHTGIIATILAAIAAVVAAFIAWLHS